MWQEHGDELDRDQERIEVIGAIEQRIVLEPDAAAVCSTLSMLCTSASVVWSSQ